MLLETQPSSKPIFKTLLHQDVNCLESELAGTSGAGAVTASSGSVLAVTRLAGSHTVDLVWVSWDLGEALDPVTAIEFSIVDLNLGQSVIQLHVVDTGDSGV